MLTLNVRKQNLKGLRKKVVELANQRYKLRVGIVDNTTYPNGTSVAYVAYLNEYGGHNPPRPFMHRTFMLYQKTALKGLYTNLQGITKQPSTKVRNAFELTGIFLKDKMKRVILSWPENDPRRNKYPHKNGDYRPLIDTHLMLNTINYRIDRITKK